MAIVQISKIIHRTGANIDLPQLDIGEIGFATDEQRVYIGNDPAIVPPLGSTTQTEILTASSTLDFSRIQGSQNASANFSTLENGQLIGVNVAANIATIVNVGGTAGGEINLGAVGNVKLNGGTNGYFLQTDGAGNLAWTSSVGNVTIPGTPGGSSTQLQFNNAGNFAGDSRLTFNVATGIMTMAGNLNATGNINASNIYGPIQGVIGATTPNLATFTSVTVNNNLIATGNVTADIVISTNNNAGENFKVGDDIWIGDINLSDTMQLKGVADSANAYIVFGDSDTNALGRSGTGPLTYDGDFEASGNVTANNIVLSTWSMFANVDGLYATDGSNTYSINMTQL
jgi:hypothetical protein